MFDRTSSVLHTLFYPLLPLPSFTQGWKFADDFFHLWGVVGVVHMVQTVVFLGQGHCPFSDFLAFHEPLSSAGQEDRRLSYPSSCDREQSMFFAS